MQGHRHRNPSNLLHNNVGQTSNGGNVGGTNGVQYDTTIALDDMVNGNPRTDQFTRPRGITAYTYEYVGRVI
jgi:hypothetical protein